MLFPGRGWLDLNAVGGATELVLAGGSYKLGAVADGQVVL